MTPNTPEKPTSHEEEYFHRQDQELMRQLRTRLDSERARSTSAMPCPRCRASLEERRIDQVVVDQCPSCGGMWLDAGELELLQHHAAGAHREHGQKGMAGFFSDLFGNLGGDRRK